MPPGETGACLRVLDPFDRQNIVHVLRQLGATADNVPFSTEALATTLTDQLAGESQEVYSARVKANEKALRVLAKSKLRGLCFGQGVGLKWVLPPDQI